jgi:hypothetical protein
MSRFATGSGFIIATIFCLMTLLLSSPSSSSSPSSFFALAVETEGNNNECPVGSSSAADGTCSTNHDNDGGNVDCGVYMAPSTVGDHSNLGIYTAKPMKDGDIVPYPEIIVPLLWRIFGVHPVESFTDGELWDRYIWEQYVGGIEAFEDFGDRSSEKSAVFIPGVGCTVNSMLELGNVESATGSKFDEVVNRSSPGAGAFTPYHSTPTTIASPDGFGGGVDAGQELFATYGDEWIPWIPDVAVTFNRNFAKADEIMEEFEDWIVEHEGEKKDNDSNTKSSENSENSSEITDELLDDMWKFMIDFPHFGTQKWEQLSVLPKEWNRERLKELKHVKKQQKLLLLQDNNEEKEESSSPLPQPLSTSTRYWADRGKVSTEFLKENGKCQDHIRPE